MAAPLPAAGRLTGAFPWTKRNVGQSCHHCADRPKLLCCLVPMRTVQDQRKPAGRCQRLHAAHGYAFTRSARSPIHPASGSHSTAPCSGVKRPRRFDAPCPQITSPNSVRHGTPSSAPPTRLLPHPRPGRPAAANRADPRTARGLPPLAGGVLQTVRVICSRRSRRCLRLVKAARERPAASRRRRG